MHVAVVVPPQHGHVAPTLGLVRHLSDRGHRVSYLSTEEFLPLLHAVGARVIPGPATDFPIATIDSAAPSLGPWLLRANVTAATVTSRHLDNDRPDLVLYDFAYRLAGYALTQRWRVRGAQLFPTFAFCEHMTFLDTTPALLGEDRGIDLSTPELIEEATLFLASSGVPVADPSAIWAAEEEVNLVFLPRSFQVRGELFGANYHFVGPILEGRDNSGSWTPPRTENPVVYVSLGTIFGASPDLFRNAVAAFAEDPVHLVLSIGRALDVSVLGPLPSNCEAHSYLPQLDVLRHADAFVSHGGMNSVMESLALGVPLTIVPHLGEQEMVAQQAAARGLGIHLPKGEASPDALRHTVHRLLNDATYVEAVAAFGDEIAAAGGASAAIEVLESGGH